MPTRACWRVFVHVLVAWALLCIRRSDGILGKAVGGSISGHGHCNTFNAAPVAIMLLVLVVALGRAGLCLRARLLPACMSTRIWLT